MDSLAQDIARIASIGIGATAVMDVWLLLLKRLKVPVTNFALIGRWVGHLGRGRWMHASMADAAPVDHELALGWLAHYAIGVAFAALLVALQGIPWTRQPTFWPALLVGVATVAVPLFVMQPAMGAGIASSKTPTPLKNCLRSLVNHAVFGAGLYLAALAVASFLR